MRYKSLFIYLISSSARQQRELAKFCVFWRTRTTVLIFHISICNWTLALHAIARAKTNARFPPAVWSKLKISRNHSMKKVKNLGYATMISNDWDINNLAKNQVSAVLHLHVICRSISPRFMELCMETPCLCPSEKHKHAEHAALSFPVYIPPPPPQPPRLLSRTAAGNHRRLQKHLLLSSEFCHWNEKVLHQRSGTLKLMHLLVQALFS